MHSFYYLTSNIVLSVCNTEAGMLGLSGGLDISITPYLTSYNDVRNTAWDPLPFSLLSVSNFDLILDTLSKLSTKLQKWGEIGLQKCLLVEAQHITKYFQP